MEIKTYDTVVKKYRHFFIFVFKYLFPILGVVVCFLLFQKIFLSTVSVRQQDDPFVLQRTKLVASFEKFLKQTIQDHDIDIFILQGPLLTQNNFVVSQDNLITYKGFVVPKNLAISTTLPLKPLSYFQNKEYAVDELANFINNFVLITQNNTSKPFQNTQIPLNDTLINNFNLTCLLETTIYPKTCDHYVQSFLSSFFVYQLATDYTGLQQIFAATQKKQSYRASFCSSIKKYLLYTNDTNAQLSDIFDTCGPEYKDFFRKMESFIDIQKQLDNKVISADTFKDQSLNAYKLLSYQQILYQDFQDFKIRTNQYTLYLEYIQELIRRDDLPQFYFDEIYRYNNNYLKPTLLTARYDRRFPGLKETDINDTLKTLETINIGTTIGGYSGLNLLVSNLSLIASATQPASAETLSLQEKISRRIAGISYLIIAQSSISENKITVKGYFLINDQRVPVVVGLLYQNDAFLVTDITLPNYPEFTASLQGLLGKDIRIGELYASVSENLPLYQNVSPVKDLDTMCADIRSLETSLDMQVSTCTNDVLVIAKTIETENVTYTFFLQNSVITNIAVSDPLLQKAVESVAGSLDLTKELKQVIQSILTAPSTTTIQHEGSANTLAALEDMQQFFGITPNDIAEKDGKILIDFTIGGINFIAYYTLTSNVLGPRYFKDILTNDKPLPIKNLSLTLTKSEQESIDLFSKDPLAAIKKLDITAWKNYIEKMK